MMRIAFGLVYFALCLATINSQFIENSHDSVHVGDDVTLKCLLVDDAQDSKDVANYVWYLNNKKVINNEHFVQSGSELTINNAVKPLSGYYSCVIEFLNSGAKLETPHELINIADPEHKHENHHDKLDSPCSFRIPKLCRNKRNKNEEDFVTLNAKEGASLVLECELSSVKDENTVRWLKDGSEVAYESFTNSSHKSRHAVDSEDYKLTIAEVSLDDDGIYDCAMYNERREFVIKSKRRYNLTVKARRLKFTTRPLPTKNVDLGAASKVHCKAAGSTKIYWTKEPDEGLPDDVEDVNGTLVFNNVKLDHKGNYTCIASNDEDSIRTTIEVQILPKFDIEPPKNLEVVELQSVYLDCVASGSPAPTIKWDHESTIISTNDGDDGRFRIFENGTLLLHEARQDDAGIYGCFIGSSAGFKRAETTLIVKSMDSHSSFEDANQEGSFMMSKAVLMTCLVALIYISLVVALMLWCRNKRLKSRSSEDPEKEQENDDTASDGDGDEKEPLNHETKNSRHNKVHQHAETQKKLVTSPSSTLIIDHLMIRYDRFIDLTKIGRGEFGEVLVGDMLESDVPALSVKNHLHVENGADEIHAQRRVHVLVKSLSKIKDESFLVEFRRQIDLYRAVDSQNVVKLFALCFEKDHHFMALEQARELKAHLVEHSEFSIQNLINFSRQIACGLDAIAKSKLTHRDIALRNCIITQEDSIVKLSSVALCKDKHANEYFKHNNKMIPLRHLAPEILQPSSSSSSSFSTASDVFACGIAIWEVMNSGALPYDTLSHDELLPMVQNTSVDYGLLFGGDKIPSELQKTLLNCWSSTPSERPTPESLITSLDALITNENGDKK